MQEETQEYLEEAKLKELVGKYSEFINFPIYLYASKEIDVPADEEDDTEADELEVTDDDTEVEDEGASSLLIVFSDCGDRLYVANVS